MKALRWEDTKRRIREINPDWDSPERVEERRRSREELRGGTVDVMAHVGDWTIRVP
jgi:hypothetical protein